LRYFYTFLSNCPKKTISQNWPNLVSVRVIDNLCSCENGRLHKQLKKALEKRKKKLDPINLRQNLRRQIPPKCATQRIAFQQGDPMFFCEIWRNVAQGVDETMLSLIYRYTASSAKEICSPKITTKYIYNFQTFFFQKWQNIASSGRPALHYLRGRCSRVTLAPVIQTGMQQKKKF
jgi:hypothetical protein